MYATTITNYAFAGLFVSMYTHRMGQMVTGSYENHEGEEPKQLSIPDCGSFCPSDRLIAIIDPLIPSPDLCGI
ncbi:hypothetical protein HUJ05_000687 [Dendroctonus ponderosae]|nr:hypothetical protein HUJ05_000687 [Dendroctonus ponderosae]